jgi:hypothetical protein
VSRGNRKKRTVPETRRSVIAAVSPSTFSRSRHIIQLAIFIMLVGTVVWLARDRSADTPDTQARAEAGSAPTSYYDLLAMTPEQLAEVDVALMNLLCAEGLPGAEDLDIPAILSKLDEWADKVRQSTERHLYRVTDPRHAEHYNHSEARLRAEFIVQVLQEDCGVRYNPDRIYEPDFSDSRDSFLHGMLPGADGGTCASMPVMYVAIGRRLGYPRKLALAKQHVFCRWDDGQERFNIDGATNGGINYPADEYYRTWPKPISDAEMKTGEFLKSLTPEEELATFLLARGMCLYANNRHAENRASLAEAHRLMPESRTLILALRSSLIGNAPRPLQLSQQRYEPWNDPALPTDVRREMAPPPDPTPGTPGIPGMVGLPGMPGTPGTPIAGANPGFAVER